MKDLFRTISWIFLVFMAIPFATDHFMYGMACWTISITSFSLELLWPVKEIKKEDVIDEAPPVDLLKAFRIDDVSLRRGLRRCTFRQCDSITEGFFHKFVDDIDAIVEDEYGNVHITPLCSLTFKDHLK